MSITLRQVEVFYYTAKYVNMSLAAESLGITQAAASLALKELENQLGENLFDRIGKKLVLNESGKAVMPEAAELIDRAIEFETFFRSDSTEGVLTVGASSTIGNYVLPEYLAGFTGSPEKSNILLNVGNTEEIINQVLNLESDIGIIEGPCHDPMINVIPWLDDELAVFTAPNHPLAAKDEITRADLEECGWILREPGSGTRVVFESQINALAMKIKIMLVLGHTEAIKNAVAKSAGVSCLSLSVLSDMEKLGRIKILSTPFLNLKRKFLIIIHKNKFHTKLMKEFLETLGADSQA